MRKKVVILFLFSLLLILIFEQCKEPEEDWSFCEGCPIESWTGDYSGSGSYYEEASNSIIDDVEVQLTIENPLGNQFKIQVLSPDYYSQTFFSSKSDSNYYFDIAGESSSIHLSLYKKSDGYKINGVAKKFHWEWVYEPDTAYILIPDHTLSFEVFNYE